MAQHSFPDNKIAEKAIADEKAHRPQLEINLKALNAALASKGLKAEVAAKAANDPHPDYVKVVIGGDVAPHVDALRAAGCALDHDKKGRYADEWSYEHFPSQVSKVVLSLITALA